MQARRVLVVVSALSLSALAAPALVACSVLTSWDGLPLGPPGDAADGGKNAADARVTTDADATPDASEGRDAAAACPAGLYLCGGDGIVGDPSTLYRCLDGGGATPAIPCAKGCARRPGRSDACICVASSPYCGNDQVVGDPSSLYECQSDYSAKLIRVCDAGCRVNANANDGCL